MPTLWNKDQEVEFFQRSLKMARPEQLFYLTKDKRFLAYWPKKYVGAKTTLQSRNAFIGSYSEKWTADFLSEIAESLKAHSVQGAVCEEIGLPKASPADVAICKTNDVIQKPENILAIIEVKMSVVWNWELVLKGKRQPQLTCIGDYRSHQGNPSLLRSDTMLKAIGKSINIRVYGIAASRIPILIVGNTPITKSYRKKVDHLRKSGIVQGFWSVNPKPFDHDGENIKKTDGEGFYRFDDYGEFKSRVLDLLKEEREFFSSMQTKKRLGQIIEIANNEPTYEAKAQRFLQLLRENGD
jgi:hypothetical protein